MINKMSSSLSTVREVQRDEECSGHPYRNITFTVLCLLWLGPSSILAIVAIAFICYGPALALPYVRDFTNKLLNEAQCIYFFWADSSNSANSVKDESLSTDHNSWVIRLLNIGKRRKSQKFDTM